VTIVLSTGSPAPKIRFSYQIIAGHLSTFLPKA
jgi:hypothetical protein